MSTIISTILCSLSAFVICFGWARRITKRNDASLLIAAAVTVCFAYLIFCAFRQGKADGDGKRQKKKLVNNFATAMQFGANNAEYFATVFTYFGYKATVIDFDNMVITKNGQNSFVSFCFMPSVSKTDWIRAVIAAKRHDCDKLYVFGQAANSDDVKACNEQLPSVFVATSEAYRLAKASGKSDFPSRQNKKRSFVAEYAFNKKRFGWYFFGALYFGATSLLSFMPVYTLVWASVLFAVSLFCLFNKKFNGAQSSVFPTD